MGKATHDAVTCSGCGYSLPFDHSGPCPRCDHRKTHHVTIRATLQLAGALRWQHVHTYYEKHPIALAVVIAVTIGSPFVGLVVAQWAGVAVGLVIV